VLYPAKGVKATALHDHCQVVQTGHKFHIMRKHYPTERLRAVAVLSLLVAGCQQSDQTLPFELAEGESATSTIGPTGGTVSFPPSFSLAFPNGSLGTSTTVDVVRRISGPFPGDAGQPVPGTAYDVGPVGTMLGVPARVELAVDPSLLQVGEDIKLSVAVLRMDGSVATFGGTYDVTNGTLVAEIDELGPIAAVVQLDAIALGFGDPPPLGGGSFPQPSAPSPVGPSLTSDGSVSFEAACSPEARQCFASGLISVWADDVVRTRLGDELFLLDPTVSASLEFVTFDQFGIPTEIIGSVSVGGDLRARFNSSVTSYEMEDGVTTGPGSNPVPTGLSVSGNIMVIETTTNSGGDLDGDVELEFGIAGIGTTQMMTIRLEAEVDFDNEDQTTVTGKVIAYVRLRVPEA
jgi:hypothetical protein